MAMTIGQWQKANPEKARAAQLLGGEINRRSYLICEFPENGTVAEQMRWFRDEFLGLASRTNDRKERADYLKQAATMAMKIGEAQGKANGTENAQYVEHLERVQKEMEEAKTK